MTMWKSHIGLISISLVGLLFSGFCNADSKAQSILDKAVVFHVAPIPSAVPGTVIIEQSTMWRQDMRKQASCYFLVKGGADVVGGNILKAPPEAILGFSCNQD